MNPRPIVEKMKYTGAYILFILLISLSLAVFSLDNFTQETNLKSYYVDEIYKNSDINLKAPDVYDEHYRNCLEGAIEQNLVFEDMNRTISCEVILGSDKITYADNIIGEVIFTEQYERSYSCTFLQCLMNKETSPVIFTKQGHDFMSNTKLFLILGTIICGLLLAVLSKSIQQGMRAFGFIFFVIGSNFFLIKFLPTLPIQNGTQSVDVSIIANLLAKPVLPVMLTLFIIGILIFVAGIVWKFESDNMLLNKVVKKEKK